MKKNKEQPIALLGKEKKHLRALAHHLEPVVYVGREGLSESLIDSTNAALLARELIKIKLGQNCPVAKKEAAEQLARATAATLVQLIGKTVILYKGNPELPKEKRLSLSK